jgi:hypothetical protein
MLLRLALIVLAFLAVPASAEMPAPALAGSWALKYEGTTIFRFNITREGDAWIGAWWRPKTFGVGPGGDSFYQVSGPAVQVRASSGKALGEWLELTFPDNRPNAVPDVFRFRLLEPDRAEMIYADTGLPAFVIARVDTDATPGPWDPKHNYRRLTVASLGLPDDPQPVMNAKPATPAAEEAKPGWTLPPSSDAPKLPPVVGR